MNSASSSFSLFHQLHLFFLLLLLPPSSTISTTTATATTTRPRMSLPAPPPTMASAPTAPPPHLQPTSAPSATSSAHTTVSQEWHSLLMMYCKSTLPSLSCTTPALLLKCTPALSPVSLYSYTVNSYSSFSASLATLHGGGLRSPARRCSRGPRGPWP